MTGYALDLVTPVRHVVTRMGGAAPAALSIEEMAADYNHPIPSDLTRIQQHEGCETKNEAVRWLIGRAVEEITRRGKRGAIQVVSENGGYKLVAEEVWFRGRRVKLHLKETRLALDGEPFDPQSGDFSVTSARMDTRHQSLPELRASLERFGWLRELPGVKDERGVTVIGHRREALAQELGIPGVWMTVEYGKGETADVNRLIAAVQSNVGSKAFTEREWKHIARYMRSQGSTEQEISEALGKAQQTVHDAVQDLPASGKSSGRGRPRKYTRAEEEQLGDLVFDQGMAQHEAQAIVRPEEPKRDWPTKATLTALAREEGRRKAGAAKLVPTGETTHRCPTCGHEHEIAA